MNLELTAIECRVLGCMIEKSITTPENYPLSLNSLVNACNQKSNRSPVMDLDEPEVLDALDELRAQHLCFRVDTAGSRVPKFKYAIPEKWEFRPAHLAILCELLIRGPQTPGELRTRGERMHAFLDLAEVHAALETMQEHEEGVFVKKLPIQAGKKEARYAQLIGGDSDFSDTEDSETTAQPIPSGPSRNERVEQLEAQVADLQEQVASLKSAFARFKEQFE